MDSSIYKPGEDNKPAGRYEEVGPRGGKLPDPHIISIDRGDRLPPTQESGHRWRRIGR